MVNLTYSKMVSSKKLLILFLLVFPILAKAQETKPKRLTWGVATSYHVVTSERLKFFAKEGYTQKAFVGYNVLPRLNVGLSAGLNTYSYANELANFPVELECKGFLSEKSTTPFAIAAIGYAFERPNEGSYGLTGDVGIGYRIKIGKSARAMPNIGLHFLNAHFTTLSITPDAWVSRIYTGALTSLYFGIRFEW